MCWLGPFVHYKFIRAQHVLHRVLVITRLFISLKKALLCPDVNVCSQNHRNIHLKLDTCSSEQVHRKGHYLLFMFEVLKRNICSSGGNFSSLFSPGNDNDSSLKAQERRIMNY